MSGLPPVLSVGRLYCDLIFSDLPRMPSLGTEIYAGGFSLHPGGGAFITAAHLASLGHPSALAAMRPAAPFAALIEADLTCAGLDLSLCAPLPSAAAPQLTVALTGAGDRAFVTHRAGPAAPPLSAGDLTRLGIAHVHVGELATLIDQPGLIDTARAAGATLSLDCAWDDSLSAEAIAAVLPRVDLFFPNAAERDHLRAIGLDESAWPKTAVKLGAAGAIYVAAGRETHAPASAVDAVDTTGAGDAFNAGFLAAWLTGAPPAACLAAGNAQGARAIAKPGGFHALDPRPGRAPG